MNSAAPGFAVLNISPHEFPQSMRLAVHLTSIAKTGWTLLLVATQPRSSMKEMSVAADVHFDPLDQTCRVDGKDDR